MRVGKQADDSIGFKRNSNTIESSPCNKAELLEQILSMLVIAYTSLEKRPTSTRISLSGAKRRRSI